MERDTGRTGAETPRPDSESNATAHVVTRGRSVVASPATLADDLRTLVASGYRAAELAMDTLQCVLGGQLVQRAVDQVAGVCAVQPLLQYSVHAPAVLDLRDQQDPETHRAILRGSVRVAGALNARVLVVHFEAHSEQRRIEEAHRAAIEEAADLAGRHKVILGIENIEVERAERVLEFVEAVSHPWVRMTYDFAHDYLAGDYFGYDHRASARACAPYAAHLHLTDNFGRFNMARLGDFALYQATPPANVAILGRGDLHLPLGWGSLPAGDVYRHFREQGYSGLLMSEHDRRTYAHADEEVCQAMQALTIP